MRVKPGSFLVWLLPLLVCLLQPQTGPCAELVFVCRPDNDLYAATLWPDGHKPPRFESAEPALSACREGDGLLLLAEDYPDRLTAVDVQLLERAAARGIRLFVEFPARLPGLETGAIRRATWERVVVASKAFGPELQPGRLLMIHDCHFVAVTNSAPHLVLARVAGFDTAAYGLSNTESWPILFEQIQGRLLVSSTKLSQFVTARYAPDRAWQPVWAMLFKWLCQGAPAPEVRWTPVVRPTYTRAESLPADAGLRAVQRGVDWFTGARLLAHPDWADRHSSMAPGVERVAPGPDASLPVGDGKRGVLEAFSSSISMDGSQPVRWYYRDDCNSEVAMAHALRSLLDDDQRSRVVASNIMDFVLFDSILQQGPRADTNSPSFGLLGWDTRPEGATVYYGDDNARGVLGQLATAAVLRSDRWDESILKCLLANFRLTGPSGFQNARIEEPELQQRGWRWYWENSDGSWGGYRECPHYQAYQWALRLWLYDKTKFKPLLDRTRRAIRHMMQVYPAGWQAESAREEGERCRMLLPLAWLVRVDDTPEHRAWLKSVADYVLSVQDASGAIAQRVTRRVANNAEYGTSECALIFANGDPATDLLYAGNFAFLGLHEAAAATGDPELARAAARLGKFLIRAQVRSDKRPELDGAWFRGFDFGSWDYWGSNGDIGWGVWSTETGWTQGWIAAVLAFQEKGTSLWQLTSGSRIALHMGRLRPLMLPDEVLVSEVPVEHAARGRVPQLAKPPAPQYSGDGPGTLTDGQRAARGNFHEGWLGWLGTDMSATVDLGQPVKLHTLRVGFLQHTAVGIFLPTQVEFSVSADNNVYTTVGTTTNTISARQPGPLAWDAALSLDSPLPVRYLRVHAQTLGRIPAWHDRAPGAEAWLFCDELLVNASGSSAAPR